jgi:hypothetical protein
LLIWKAAENVGAKNDDREMIMMMLAEEKCWQSAYMETAVFQRAAFIYFFALPSPSSTSISRGLLGGKKAHTLKRRANGKVHRCRLPSPIDKE